MHIKGLQDTITWYNQNAQAYSKATYSHAHPEQIDQFVALLPSGAKKVLDAGCGAGRDTHLLSLRGLEVTGIDLSEGLLSEAKKAYPRLNFVHGDIRSLRFENASIDGIWAHASLLDLETVEDVTKALSEFSRVIKKHGILHVFVKAQTGSEKTAVVSDALSHHDRFFQYFTREELTLLLKRAGFALLSLEQFRETERNPHGRPEVEWLLALAKKN